MRWVLTKLYKFKDPFHSLVIKENSIVTEINSLVSLVQSEGSDCWPLENRSFSSVSFGIVNWDRELTGLPLSERRSIPKLLRILGAASPGLMDFLCSSWCDFLFNFFCSLFLSLSFPLRNRPEWWCLPSGWELVGVVSKGGVPLESLSFEQFEVLRFNPLGELELRLDGDFSCLISSFWATPSRTSPANPWVSRDAALPIELLLGLALPLLNRKMGLVQIRVI